MVSIMLVSKFKPSKQEKIKIKKIIRDFIKKVKIKDAKVMVGGSGAKDTWLPGTHDIDIFVKFNYTKFKDKSDRLDDILEKYLKKYFKKIERLHGSRDYFRVKFKDYTFEIVPILDIKKVEEAKNITDISPLHVKWVNKHRYKDDIRKLKLLCKKNKLYGAESYIRGFSGYSLEILCIYYKGFDNVIKNVAKWKSKVVIDPEKQLKEPLKELNKSKIQSPLILVDPVDKTRNVTAALSEEKFKEFIRLCKNYLKNPSDKFFEDKKEKIPKNSVILKVEPLEGKEDIVATKMMKAYEFIRDELKRNGFKIKSNWDYDSKIFWFDIKNKLSKYELKVGPFVNDEINVKRFKQKHRNIIKKKNRYYAKVKRKYTLGRNLIKNLIKKKEIMKRVKSIRFIK